MELATRRKRLSSSLPVPLSSPHFWNNGYLAIFMADIDAINEVTDNIDSIAAAAAAETKEGGRECRHHSGGLPIPA